MYTYGTSSMVFYTNLLGAHPMYVDHYLNCLPKAWNVLHILMIEPRPLMSGPVTTDLEYKKILPVKITN